MFHALLALMQSMVPLPTTRQVLVLLAPLVTPQSLQLARWAIPPALVALVVTMAHPQSQVMLMLAIQPLGAKPVVVEHMLLLDPLNAPLALLDVMALARLTNAQELALLVVMALAQMFNAQELVR